MRDLSDAATKLRHIICLYLATILGVLSMQTQTRSGGQGPLGRASPDLKYEMVVEDVMKNFEAEKNGIQNGDVLRGWVRGDDKGQIESPFDLFMIEIEQAPRGPVTLQGQRGERNKSWILGPDRWG